MRGQYRTPSKNASVVSLNNQSSYEDNQNLSPGEYNFNKSASKVMSTINQSTAKLTTNYQHNIDKVQHKIDAVPYEQFPFCCRSKNVQNFDVDMTNRPLQRRAEVKMIEVQQESLPLKQSRVTIQVIPIKKLQMEATIDNTIGQAIGWVWTERIVKMHSEMRSTF